MKKSIIIYSIAALMALVASSCSRETFDLQGGVRPAVETKPGDLAFNASLSYGPATRSDYKTFEVEVPSTGETIALEGYLLPMAGGAMSGEPATRGTLVEEMYGSFAFSALPYEGKEAVRNSQGLYTVSGLRYSDFEDVAQFICWAPKDAEGVTYDPSARTFRYDTPTDIPTQPDFVVANPASATPDREDPLELTFYHALSGLAFNTSTYNEEAKNIFPDCTVQSIVLKGVYGSGVYDPMSKTWIVDSDSVIDLPLLQGNVTATSGTTLTGGEYTALLVPQELPAGCELEVKLTFKGLTYTYTYPMEGTSLEMGTVFTFSLNGRSMYLFEGTATGPFDVETVWYPGHSDSKPYFDVTADMIDPETGHFSILLPVPPDNRICFGNASPRTGAQGTLQGPDVNNYALTEISRFPDFMWSLDNASRNLMFSGCVALERITGDMSWTHRMTNFYGFFNDCSALKEFPEIYTENATTMESMFNRCTQIETIPCVLDTKKVTTMVNMFNRCTNLKSIPPLDTPVLRLTTGMFYECRNLVDVPLFNTSGCTNMARMFYNCQKLPSIPAFDTGNNKDFSSMFYQCYNLKEYSTIDTKNGTTLASMFQGCSSLPEIKVTDTSKATSFNNFAAYCSSIVSAPDNLDFSSAKDVHGIYRNCSSLVTIPSYSFPEATDFSNFASDCKQLKTVGPMDTPKAKSFYQAFWCNYKLEESPLRNTSTATGFVYAFREAGRQAPHGMKWYDIDMSNVTDLHGIFMYAWVPEVSYLNTPKLSTVWNDAYGERGMLIYNGTITFGGADLSNAKSGQYYTAPKDVVNHGPLNGMKYSVNLSGAKNLTHESLMNIINSIADITATAAEDPQELNLGATNAAKLSADEIAVATAKGWTVVTQ